WSKVSKILRDYDEVKIDDCKEDIDTLLVFAGLFSAVLTAFNIESYRALQQDTTVESLRVLEQISLQIAGFAVTNGTSHSAIPAFSNTPSSFTPSSSAVRINALWFSSLVCSLITASLGILVKQWLREYMARDTISPRAHVRIRRFRLLGLLRWRVFEIASFLPLLLQVALALFLIGLGEFLRLLDPLIGWIITALVIAWLVFYGCSALAPLLSSQCPYKTP
ncbi:hypothetical protein C8Q75DRAFT_692074, partial [Abortiporus biennis]